MPSDFEKFKELYESLEIPFNKDSRIQPDGSFSVTLAEHEVEGLVGYPGFHTVIVFDKDGKFLRQEFWE